MSDNPSQKKDNPGSAVVQERRTVWTFGPDFEPFIPTPSQLWTPVRNWVWILYAIVILAALPHYFVQYWFNQSLGYYSIFFTNLKMQLFLFLGYGTLVFAGINVPMRLYARSPVLRKGGFHFGVWIGLFAGWRAAHHFLEFLLATHGVPFGKTDPVFGHDIGFYVYWLPILRLLVTGFSYALVLGIVSTAIARYDQIRSLGVYHRKDVDFWGKASLFFPAYMKWLWDLEGIVVAFFLFLLRYNLLFKDNEDTGVRIGAAALDISGLFSTVNYIYISIFVELSLCYLLGVWMKRLDQKYGWIGSESADAKPPVAATQEVDFLKLGKVALYFLAFDFLFFAGVVVRNHVFVRPNEPYVQIPYIQRHIEATLSGYRLNQIKQVPWELPKNPSTPAQLLASKTVQNTPFLPGWVAYLEEPPDVQHLERLQLSDSLMVYGPMLQIFNQQQSLRPYYQFANVDSVRYTVDGEKKMFVSSVRELPSLAFLGPKEWLRYWGSAALMFTHGYGLVISPINQVDELGNPMYVSKDVPPKVTNSVFEHEPRIYFGEGAKDDYILTNVRNLKEFDHATEQFREEFAMPKDLKAGIRMDSIWKRIMFAFRTKDLTAFLFSRYIDSSQTRVHINRTPMYRANAIAPFLFLESNNYAFIANKKVYWMVNALTTSNMYPYAFREMLGDKADERAVHQFPEREINYAEDSVKIVMDAYSGDIKLYQMNNDPIISSWAKVYTDLFRPYSEMPGAERAQLTYPLQWYHIQFDDIYKRYHQQDPIQFYNVEDIWDDADEVLGSIGRGLKGFGSTDQSTFSFEGHSMLIDPGDLPPGVNIGTPGKPEYCLLMPFTPEGNRNLRSVILAYQDPENYGKLVSLQIPQGEFVPGPEQIESYIDNDRPVHQQVTMWIRHASEVIRGHMCVLPVRGDLMYVETIWVNSTQNELPQLKLFAVRYHGRITSGTTLADAVGKQQEIHLAEDLSVPAEGKEEGAGKNGKESKEEEKPEGKRPKLPPQAISHPPQ
jgi:uncharacterized protein